MRKEVFARSPLSALRYAVTPVLFTLLIMAMILYGLEQTRQANRKESARILEEGILRAVTTCYAVEGRYPDSLSYLEQHYGLRVDKAKYAVHYEIFASNILPEITVVELAQ